MKKQAKTERFEMRMEPSIKEMAETKAKKKGLSVAKWLTAYIRRAR